MLTIVPLLRFTFSELVYQLIGESCFCNQDLPKISAGVVCSSSMLNTSSSSSLKKPLMLSTAQASPSNLVFENSLSSTSLFFELLISKLSLCGCLLEITSSEA